ncbi:hypothetical protein FKM82_007394 [Ascaphus truei]
MVRRNWWLGLRLYIYWAASHLVAHAVIMIPGGGQGRGGCPICVLPPLCIALVELCPRWMLPLLCAASATWSVWRVFVDEMFLSGSDFSAAAGCTKMAAVSVCRFEMSNFIQVVRGQMDSPLVSPF